MWCVLSTRGMAPLVARIERFVSMADAWPTQEGGRGDGCGSAAGTLHTDDLFASFHSVGSLVMDGNVPPSGGDGGYSVQSGAGAYQLRYQVTAEGAGEWRVDVQ